MFDTYAQVLPMGQTMSDTPEAPKQSLGKRVRFGDEPSLTTSDEGAATSALATLAEAAAVESIAEANCSGASCSGTAGGPAVGGAAESGPEDADGGAALDRAAAALRGDLAQLEWVQLDGSGRRSAP